MHSARTPNLPTTPNCLDTCVTTLLYNAGSTRYRRQEEAGWGKAEADSATGREGAECEKITSHSGGKGPGGVKRMDCVGRWGIGR